MQKVIRLSLFFFTFLFLPRLLCAQQINAEEIFEINANLIRSSTVAGTKVVYPVTGGSLTGKIKGKVLPIGGDFATFISPTTLKLDVRLILQTEDSVTIYCTYTGYLNTDEETFKIIKAGKGAQLDPSRYYFRTNPIFETSSAKYDWLNHTVTVGFGAITQAGVRYKIYAIK
ncbi:MAG: hypothetical protein JWQ09_3655 [Segetibacter sp.]|nr:hypothetical protein [Segetibacter sp.]